MSMPPWRRRIWTETELPEEVIERYQGLLRGLLALPLADPAKRRPHVLELSPAAKKLWVSFYNEWGAVQADAEGEQAAAFAKIEAYAARLMLLHHVVAHVAAGVDDRCPITEVSATTGIALARWFAEEAKRIYATLSETEDERDLRSLIQFVHRHRGTITAKELQRSNGRKYPDTEAANTALDGLVSGGLGRWEERPAGPRGGRPTRTFILELPSDETDETSPSEESDGSSDEEQASDETSDETPPIPTFPQETEGFVGFVGRCSEVPGAPEAEMNGQEATGGFVGRVEEVSSGANQDGYRQPVTEESGDCERARRFMEELLSRPKGGGQQAPYQHAQHPTPYLLIDQADQLPALVGALDEAAVVALDLETTGLDPRKDRPRLLSLALPTMVEAYLLDLLAVDPAPVLEALAGKELIGHNLIFDLGFLDRLGFEPSGKIHDTLILSRILYAGEGPQFKHTLAACAPRELGETLDKTEQRSDWSGALTDSQLAYAARDVLVLPRLRDALAKKIAEADLERTAGIEARCLPAVAWMAAHGVAVDRQAWLVLVEQAEQEAAWLKQEMAGLAPVRPNEFFASWNFDSPADLLVLFRDALDFAVKDTSDETLAGLDHPLAGLLRKYREATKRTGTYGRQWLKHIAQDGRVYASWNQTGSEAGRMSCSAPNMQQLPRDRAYRRCIVAPPGRLLIKADYSQIELRIAARVSGDPALLEAYRQGIDVHRQTAQQVLGKEDVTKDDRQLAKALNFGLLYGMGASGFRKHARSEYGLDLTDEQATAYRAAFFRTYRGLAAWHRQVKARKGNETRTLAGRRRLIPSARADKTEKERRRFEAAMDRQRLNTPVQGTGADGLKLALALLWERRDQCPGAFPVLAVHDEIVVEADAAQADAAANWLKQAMMDAMAPLIDPVLVEVEVTVAGTWAGD
jgi:DNA polymerase-1